VKRSAPYVVRLSMIYALLDKSELIEEKHLRSAKAVWDYAERTSKFVFGNSLGDRTAEQILVLLQDAGDAGLMTREITARIVRKKDVPNALRLLLENEQITVTPDRKGDSKGAMGQRWKIRL
jgi:hypothetical protein